MKRRVITTDDGSKTIKIEEWNEHYHSTHGAIQESKHVYIQAGLEDYVARNQLKPIIVLEAGFGTGLNALLTYLWSEKSNIKVDYIGIEAYPISEVEKEALDYDQAMNEDRVASIFEQLHQAKWEQWEEISKMFSLKKLKLFFADVELQNQVDVIFYDAFGPRVQPELWEKSIFERFHKALRPNGVLVTYCVKGTARRALQEIGFKVDIIEGPPGKRHMMRAYKSH